MSAPTLPNKAESVHKNGQPDGFVPDTFFRPEVLEGGMTRLVVSVPLERLEAVHQALVATVSAPMKLLYVQLTDRQRGVQLPKPVQRVAVELPSDRVMSALQRYRRLVYHDGRHQIWIRGSAGEQIVLEEVGALYVYPDDFSFRDVLLGLGVPQGDGAEMATRDYVKVTFDAAADADEDGLLQELNLIEWAG